MTGKMGSPKKRAGRDKKSDESLGGIEGIYRSLVETAGAGIATFDGEGKITFVNDRICLLTGYSKVDLIGNPFSLYIHPDDLPGLREAFQAAVGGTRRSEMLEFRLIRKDGQCIWMHTNPEPMFTAGQLSGFSAIIYDITGRKQLEEALGKSEERYRTMLDQMQDTYHELDLGGKFTFVSESATRSFGFSQEDLIGKSFRLAVPAEDARHILAAFNEVYRTGKPNKGVAHRIRHKDGSITYSEASVDLNRDGQGKVTGFKVVNRDITGRRQMEVELKRLASVVQYSGELVNLATVDGQIIFINDAGARILGIDQHEVGKYNVMQVIPDHLKEKAGVEVLCALAKGETWEGDLQYVNVRTGQLTDVHTMAFVVKDPLTAEPLYIANVSLDITERKRAEQALRESEEKYRLLVENALEAICIAVDGAFKFVNRRTMELTGYSWEELTSRPFMEFVYPADRPLAVERYLQRLKGINVPDKFVFRVILKSGNTRWVELSAVPIIWEGKLATLNFLTDITDRRHLEEEQQRVAKLESVGLLAGGIAHDFNNILTSILGNISLARMEAAPGSELGESLEQAEKASMRAKDLTQQLLTFSRGGAPVTRLASLAELLKDTVGFALRGTNIKCHLHIPTDLWHAEIDAGQVSQVIHNLVINAQQAMPAGGTVDIRAENLAISEAQSLGKGLPLQAGNYVRVAVADHGSGIDAAHLERIFDPFFTTKQKGSGLGLATSFSIARNHGGHISVESEPGSGSTFYLYLPASLETAAPAQDAKAAARADGGARILVMDDEQGVRDVAGRMLASLGYEDIEFAAEGSEAVRLYRAAMEAGRPFTVAILDLTIAGGMGGRETVGNLLKIDPGARVIVSSGYADDPVIARYRDYGFSGMVAKPYTLGELGRALRDMTG